MSLESFFKEIFDLNRKAEYTTEYRRSIENYRIFGDVLEFGDVIHVSKRARQ